MLVLIFIASGLVILGATISAIRRANPSRALGPAARPAPSIFTLAPGDIVQHLATDYIVQSTVTYTEDGLSWQEHQLSDQPGHDDRWLVVEEDDQLVVALFDEVDDPPAEVPVGDAKDRAGAPPRTLVHRGATFRLHEKGTATVKRRHAASGREDSYTCTYWDYEGPDGDLLSVELSPGETEVFRGRKLPPASLTILPGS